MKNLALRLWNEPALFLASLAVGADAVLLVGLDLPAWVALLVHAAQGLGTRLLVTPANPK